MKCTINKRDEKVFPAPYTCVQFTVPWWVRASSRAACRDVGVRAWSFSLMETRTDRADAWSLLITPWQQCYPSALSFHLCASCRASDSASLLSAVRRVFSRTVVYSEQMDGHLCNSQRYADHLCEFPRLTYAALRVSLQDIWQVTVVKAFWMFAYLSNPANVILSHLPGVKYNHNHINKPRFIVYVDLHNYTATTHNLKVFVV